LQARFIVALVFVECAWQPPLVAGLTELADAGWCLALLTGAGLALDRLA